MDEIDRKSIAQTGLCISDFAVLEVLLHKGPLPVNTIGAKVLLTSGSISTAVDRLEERKLVRRAVDKTDRRVCQVHLTAPGGRLIKKAFAQHRRNLERAMSSLTPAEKDKAAALLVRLGRQAAEDFESETP